MERVNVDNGSVIELPKYFELSNGRVCKLVWGERWHDWRILYFDVKEFWMHDCGAVAFDAEEFEGMRELSEQEYAEKVDELAKAILER